LAYKRAWPDVVHRDFVLCQFHCDGSRQHPQAPFAGAVGCVCGHRKIFMNGGNVDQPAALSLLDHLTSGRLANQKRPNQVDIQDLLQFFERIIHKREFLLDSRIVDNDVEPAETLSPRYRSSSAPDPV
jgi:hypothetical protein